MVSTPNAVNCIIPKWPLSWVSEKQSTRNSCAQPIYLYNLRRVFLCRSFQCSRCLFEKFSMSIQSGLISSPFSLNLNVSAFLIIPLLIWIFLGAQWGDEGKGKVVDMLATESDVVCRCQVRSSPLSFIRIRSGTLLVFFFRWTRPIFEKLDSEKWKNQYDSYVQCIFHSQSIEKKNPLPSISKFNLYRASRSHNKNTVTCSAILSVRYAVLFSFAQYFISFAIKARSSIIREINVMNWIIKKVELSRFKWIIITLIFNTVTGSVLCTEVTKFSEDYVIGYVYSCTTSIIRVENNSSFNLLFCCFISIFFKSKMCHSCLLDRRINKFSIFSDLFLLQQTERYSKIRVKKPEQRNKIKLRNVNDIFRLLFWFAKGRTFTLAIYLA